MHHRKDVNDIISIERNTAPIATSIILVKTAGEIGAANKIIANISVPIIPTRRHIMCLHKHDAIALSGLSALKNSATTTIISASPLSPSAIHTAVTINGMLVKANNKPTTTPTTMLNNIAMQHAFGVQHLQLQLQSQLIFLIS